MEHIFTLEFIKKCQLQMKQRDIKSLPEQIAFNLIMAIAPLMIVLVQIATYFSIQTDFLERLLYTYLKNEQIIDYFREFIDNATATSSNGFLIIITALPFFWSISKGFYGISIATNTTYQVPLMRFAFIERIIAFITVFFMIIFLIIILIFTLFGRHLINLFLHLADLQIPAFTHSILGIFGSLIAFISYFGFFLLLFYFSPTIKLKFSEIVPGAFITATGWSIASIIFSFYINTIANYSLYGSLAAVIIILLWLYILGYMITVGLQVNYILKRDYLGGVTYHPRLPFGKKLDFFSKWATFESNKEE